MSPSRINDRCSSFLETLILHITHHTTSLNFHPERDPVSSPSSFLSSSAPEAYFQASFLPRSSSSIDTDIANSPTRKSSKFSSPPYHICRLTFDKVLGEVSVSTHKFNSIKELIDIDNHLPRLVYAPSSTAIVFGARNTKRQGHIIHVAPESHMKH